MKLSGQLHTHAALCPGKSPGYPLNRRLVGTRFCLDNFKWKTLAYARNLTTILWDVQSLSESWSWPLGKVFVQKVQAEVNNIHSVQGDWHSNTILFQNWQLTLLFEMEHGTRYPEVLFLSLKHLKVQKIKLYQICIIFENVEYLEINIDLLS